MAGKGPDVLDPRTGELLSTWVFVMTLAWSRHGYAEIVTDEKVATWLGCPRAWRLFSCYGVAGTTAIDVWIGNSHRHYRPGLPSVARCFLSRVLLGSSIASTDWMNSTIYSGGRPCSLPPARTKSLYQL